MATSHLHVPPHHAPPRCICHVTRPSSPHMPCCHAPCGCVCHLTVLLNHMHCISGLLAPAYILLVHFFFLFSVNYLLQSSHHAPSPCSLLMNMWQSFPSRAYHSLITNCNDKGMMAMTCSDNSDYNNCNPTVAPCSTMTVTATLHYSPTPHGAINITATPHGIMNITATPHSATTTTITPCSMTTTTLHSTMTITLHITTTMTAIPYNRMTVTMSTFCFY
jgi:hypothetical protein